MRDLCRLVQLRAVQTPLKTTPFCTVGHHRRRTCRRDGSSRSRNLAGLTIELTESVSIQYGLWHRRVNRMHLLDLIRRDGCSQSHNILRERRPAAALQVKVSATRLRGAMIGESVGSRTGATLAPELQVPCRRKPLVTRHHHMDTNGE